MATSPNLLILFLSIQTLFISSQATVPASARFTYINQGNFGEYIIEYDGTYRCLRPFASPFQLCFYNTTANAYTLGIRMGLRRSESMLRWVWEANRGNPVGENATFSLGSNGNLVLAHSDGRVAWQSNTANKNVVGFALLSTGNMVLRDSAGKFVWQSFDSPTDTLLVGQSLRVGAVTKLVSRISEQVNSNGPYSLVLESNTLVLYYKNVILFNAFFDNNNTLSSVTFNSEPDNRGSAYNLELEYNLTNTERYRSVFLARPKYNSTLSIMRLDIDGNLRVYTYYAPVSYSAWEVTYAYFSPISNPGDVTRAFDRASECAWPERCGELGVCEDNQCVACPKPNGLLGWSKNCKAAKVKGCGVNDFYYYKVEGVEHFSSGYNSNGIGPITEKACGEKCTKDCKCLGYFYHRDTSMCWIAYQLKTLAKVKDTKHIGYIKAPKSTP